MSFRCFSLSSRACFWNTLFNDLTLSLSPTLFASFLLSAILMASFESHGVVLPFFFFGMCIYVIIYVYLCNRFINSFFSYLCSWMDCDLKELGQHRQCFCELKVSKTQHIHK